MKNYYIKEGVVYSNEKSKIIIPIDYEDFIERFSKFEKIDNNNIIEVLNEYKKLGYKEYIIYGEIENFNSVVENIKKSKIKKPRDDDYQFLEITSQILVIKQLKEIIEKVKSNFPPHNIIKLLDDAEKKRKEEKEELGKELEKVKKKYEEKNQKYNKQLKEDIEKKETLIKNKNLELNQLKKQEEEEQKKLNDITNENEISKNINKLKKEIEELGFEKQKLEYDIKVLEDKLNTLKNEKKLGTRKKIYPTSFILTLGLIYWTKYSNISQIIAKNHVEIYKKKEKISQLERKIFTKKHRLENLLENDKTSAKQRAKQQEDINQNIESIGENVQNREKEISKLKSDLEKSKDEIIPIREEIDELSKKINKIEEKANSRQSSVKEEGHQIINKIHENHQDQLEQLEKIEKKINSQKTSIKGEGIINI